MKQTLLDAETVALDAKKESAFLSSENLELKEKMVSVSCNIYNKTVVTISTFLWICNVSTERADKYIQANGEWCSVISKPAGGRKENASWSGERITVFFWWNNKTHVPYRWQSSKRYFIISDFILCRSDFV